MDPVQTQTADPIADLASKSPEELQSLEADLVAQFDAADEADDLDTMSAVADQIDAVRAQMESAGAAAPGAPAEAPPAPAVPEPEAAAEAETPAETVAEGGVEEPDTSGSGKENPFTKKKKTPVAASAEAPSGDSGGDTAPVEAGTEAVEVQAETETEEGVEGEDEGEQQPEAVAEPESGEEDPPAPEDVVEADPDVGDDEGEADEADPEAQPEAVAAGGDNKEEDVDIPEERKPVAVTASANEILAGTDIPGFAAGMPFKDRLAVAQAMERRLDTVRRATGGDGTQHTVATIVASAPADRMLDPNDVEGNLAKIEEVVRAEAITAAGGYCAPLETRYDIFGTGTTSRPVRDALAGFQARRGGIRYTAAPKIADFAGASGLWTAANDENPTTPATKPCLVVECQPEVTAMVDAVTLCLQFGNLMTRAYPELIDRNNQLALVAHARYAERVLLDKLEALSTSVTSSFVLGTTRDFLNAVGRAATAYRHRYRMEPTQPLRILAPIWVRDAVREDLAMQMPGDNTLSVADNIIDQYLRDRNVNASWHLDAPGFLDEVEGSALNDFPTSFEWFIYAEGAFLFLDGGTLDLGIVRDSDLVATNDYKTFTESFEGVARIGAESIHVTTTTQPAGATAGTVDTTP